MAFDFPAAPALNEVYTAAGVDYVWDGQVWSFSDVTGAPSPYVKKAGDVMLGPLVLIDPNPTQALESTHKRYVDETVAMAMLYQGPWQVASNVPDLHVPPNAPLNGYSWIAQTVDPNLPEIAVATLPGIGGMTIAALDTVRWNATTSIYELIKGAVGISQMTIADAPPATGFHGQLWWDSDAAKTYVYYDDGTSAQWVMISGGGGGTNIVPSAPTFPAAPTDGELFFHEGDASLYIYHDDGTSQQWVEISATGAGGGVTETDPLSLHLTGGELTGDFGITKSNPTINLDRATAAETIAIYYRVAGQAFWRENLVGDTWSFDCYKAAAGGGGASFIMSFNRTAGTCDFNITPTSRGVPMVLKTDHDAAIAKLEARLAALEKRK